MIAAETECRIDSARDAASLFAPFFEGATGEMLLVAYLDADRVLLRLSTMAGEREDVALPVTAITREAINQRARGLIVAHNHPSGDPRPSAADRAGTRRLADTLAELGVAVHDHLVFGGGDCRSFRALGWL